MIAESLVRKAICDNFSTFRFYFHRKIHKKNFITFYFIFFISVFFAFESAMKKKVKYKLMFEERTLPAYGSHFFLLFPHLFFGVPFAKNFRIYFSFFYLCTDTKRAARHSDLFCYKFYAQIYSRRILFTICLLCLSFRKKIGIHINIDVIRIFFLLFLYALQIFKTLRNLTCL